MDIFKLIKSRRSVRRFKKGTIPAALVRKILDAGRFAPSGLNNQPWRFLVLTGGKKDNLVRFTKYGRIIKSTDKIILVFLDKNNSYHCEKDLLAIGACIQNMLLTAHSLKVGACWLGEILNRRKGVNVFLEIPPGFRLEAVVALGWPAIKPLAVNRKSLRRLVL